MPGRIFFLRPLRDGEPYSLKRILERPCYIFVFRTYRHAAHGGRPKSVFKILFDAAQRIEYEIGIDPVSGLFVRSKDIINVDAPSTVRSKTHNLIFSVVWSEPK